MGKRVLLTLAAALAVAPFIVSGVAGAQPTATPTPTPHPTPAPENNELSNNYFSNAGVSGLPAGQVRIVNNSGGYLCANIYVTDPYQEMVECCACNLSDKSTRILSVDGDLTSNPGTGVPVSDGSVAIVSGTASGSSCGDPAKAKPVPELSAWETHPQTGGYLTEEEFTPVPLAKAALADLQAECAALELIGSGHGICTCGTGD